MMPMPVGAELADDLEELLATRRRSARTVGSSMMMTRASSDRALAISTICIWPAVRIATGVVGGRSRPTRLSSPAATCVHLAGGERRGEAAPARRSLPRKMLAAMSRLGASISSWWIRAMPSRLASLDAAERDRLAVDSDLALVGDTRRRGSSSACSCPPRSRPSARALRPAQGEATRPGSATTPGKRLVMPCMREEVGGKRRHVATVVVE